MYIFLAFKLLECNQKHLFKICLRIYLKKKVSEQFRLDLVCLNANNKQMYKATNNKQHGTFAIIRFIK